MDPITQGALGAACSQAILYKYDKRNAWLIGALGGMAADLDVLIRSATDPMLFLIYHRQFTHSFLFIPLGALLVALALLPFKRFRKNWHLTFLAALIGYSTHALLDACTSYGTVLYWPFSYQRIAWDFISIIDPLFTVPLILGIFWTSRIHDRKYVLIGLLIAGLYMGFHVWQHHRALAAVEYYGKITHQQLRRVRVLPALTSAIRWHAVGYAGNQQLIGEVKTPLFKESKFRLLGIFPRFKKTNLPAYVHSTTHQLRDYKIFNWFADGYLIEANRHPLVLADSRYLSNEKPLTALWGILFKPDRAHVVDVRNIVIFPTLPSISFRLRSVASKDDQQALVSNNHGVSFRLYCPHDPTNFSGHKIPKSSTFQELTSKKVENF